MRLRVLVCLSLGIALLLGCVTPNPPPGPADPQASVIGVAVKIRGAIKLFSNGAEWAHFVRLDSDGNEESEPILSNYSSGKYVYLVNAAPGRYAVVAAGFTQQSQGAPMGSTTSLGGGFSLSTSVTVSSTKTITSYLPRHLIEKTAVTVGEGQMVFIGELVIDTSGDWDSADAEQLRHYRLIAPGHEDKSFMAKLFSGKHRRGIEHEVDQGGDARSRFLAHSGGEFSGVSWEGVLRNPVASGPPAVGGVPHSSSPK